MDLVALLLWNVLAPLLAALVSLLVGIGTFVSWSPS